MVRDVTSRRAAEKKIRAQAALLDQANEAILVIDLKGHIQYWNQGASRLYGRSSKEAIGQCVDDLLSLDKVRYQDALDLIQKEKEWNGELKQLGSHQEPIIVDSRWTLLQESDDSTALILIINNDITEKKKLQEEMLREQKLESLGRLASGITHDLQNVLTPICLSADLLKDYVPEELSRALVDPLRASAERGADMVQRILSYTRGGDQGEAEVRPEMVLRELVKILERTLPRTVQMEAEMAPNLHHGQGDGCDARGRGTEDLRLQRRSG